MLDIKRNRMCLNNIKQTVVTGKSIVAEKLNVSTNLHI